MTRFPSPAASALWARIQAESSLGFGPMVLNRQPDGIDIRHRLDAAVDAAGLRCLPASDLRALAQADALGRFRPNKASPGLVRGWFHRVTDAESLETALNDLLPGGLADWHALRTGSATPVRWQEFVDRQTGMYRNVSSLAEPEAELVARAGCHPDCCTRRRRWTVGDRPPEPEVGKSEVPCLEPCALVLELARRTAKAIWRSWTCCSNRHCGIPTHPSARATFPPWPTHVESCSCARGYCRGSPTESGSAPTDHGARCDPSRADPKIRWTGREAEVFTWPTPAPGVSIGP
jgi:hypothetical protein